MKRTSLCVLLVLICCHELRSQEQGFSLPNQPLPRPPNLQVDGQGRAFVTAGNQLMRLDSSLVPEQTINLSSVAVNMSLSSGGDWLVVCTTNLSCAVHDANDLTVVRRCGILAPIVHASRNSKTVHHKTDSTDTTQWVKKQPD